MSAAAWIALLVTWTIAVASPGPDFVAVLRAGATRGRRDALLVGAGVVTGIACWIVLALTGLGLLLVAHPGLYTALRVAGAVFLVGYGLRILWATRPGATQAHSAGPDGGTDEDPAPGDGTPTRSGLAAWRLGLVTNAANPKAVVFFGALFAGLLPAGATPATRVAVLVVMLLVAAGWFAGVARLAGSGAIVRGYRRAARGVDRVLGGVFVALGGALLAR